MKRIKQYIMFGAAALMTASCSDFLDTTPYDALSTVHLTLVTTISPGKDTKTWPTVI